MTKRALSVSLLLLAGTAFLGGCGPENIDDMAYVTDAADKDAEVAKPAMPEATEEEEADKPVAAPATTIAAPTQVVQLPTRYVRLPSQAQTEAPVITNSREDRQFAQDVLHQRNVHIHQPSINKHLIHKNLMINNKYHTTVVNHPSFRNVVGMTSSVSQTTEELPTTVVNAPTTNYVGGFYNVGYGVRPGCAPWLSGGFYRYCGRHIGAFPVNGPYYR